MTALGPLGPIGPNLSRDERLALAAFEGAARSPGDWLRIRSLAARARARMLRLWPGIDERSLARLTHLAVAYRYRRQWYD